MIACVWARAFKETYGKDNLKIVCIAPVSLMKEWKKTAEAATGLEVEPDKGIVDENSMELKVCSWAKVPTDIPASIPNFVVICDEAHSMQSMEAARTKQTLQLVNNER